MTPPRSGGKERDRIQVRLWEDCLAVQSTDPERMGWRLEPTVRLYNQGEGKRPGKGSQHTLRLSDIGASGEITSRISSQSGYRV